MAASTLTQADFDDIRTTMTTPNKLKELKTDIIKYRNTTPKYRKAKWLANNGRREAFLTGYINDRSVKIHSDQEYADLGFVVYFVMSTGWKLPE